MVCHFQVVCENRFLGRIEFALLATDKKSIYRFYHALRRRDRRHRHVGLWLAFTGTGQRVVDRFTALIIWQASPLSLSSRDRF